MIIPSPAIGAYAAARSPVARPAASGGASTADTTTAPVARSREGKPTQADDTDLASASRTYSSTGTFRRQRSGVFVDIDY